MYLQVMYINAEERGTSIPVCNDKKNRRFASEI